MQKPVVRDGVIKYVWSTGDARALRMGAGDVSTYTVNTMLILKGLLDHAKELGLFFWRAFRKSWKSILLSSDIIRLSFWEGWTGKIRVKGLCTSAGGRCLWPGPRLQE